MRRAGRQKIREAAAAGKSRRSVSLGSFVGASFSFFSYEYRPLLSLYYRLAAQPTAERYCSSRIQRLALIAAPWK